MRFEILKSGKYLAAKTFAGMPWIVLRKNPEEDGIWDPVCMADGTFRFGFAEMVSE